MPSIQELFDQGVTSLRLPQWRDPRDHIEIDVVVIGENRMMGPWAHLKFPALRPDDVQSILVMDCALHDPNWEPWDGIPTA